MSRPEERGHKVPLSGSRPKSAIVISILLPTGRSLSLIRFLVSKRRRLEMTSGALVISIPMFPNRERNLIQAFKISQSPDKSGSY
jgi:hypothetical protein